MLPFVVVCLGIGWSVLAAAQGSTDFPEAGEPLLEDAGVTADPIPLWGSIDCQRPSRHQLMSSAGDPHPTPQGEPPAEESYRRLKVLDRDDYFGERCELGRNDYESSPVALYHEGERRLTFVSLRLPEGFPLRHKTWQLVMQMKQTQPAANGGGVPVLALQASDGHWRLQRAAKPSGIWSGRAQIGVWTRFAFDVTYSRDPSIGSVTVYADLNGDGDASDPDERSPEIETRTLKREKKGGPADGIAPGESIPSHLRVGIYHDPLIKCPAPSGCFVDVDNVGVYEPG
jgi:Polysaccharide lyase